MKLGSILQKIVEILDLAVKTPSPLDSLLNFLIIVFLDGLEMSFGRP